jgi:hypothetical protein
LIELSHARFRKCVSPATSPQKPLRPLRESRKTSSPETQPLDTPKPPREKPSTALLSFFEQKPEEDTFVGAVETPLVLRNTGSDPRVLELKNGEKWLNEYPSLFERGYYQQLKSELFKSYYCCRRQNNDLFAVIEGLSGTGKSFFLVWLICELMFGHIPADDASSTSMPAHDQDALTIIYVAGWPGLSFKTS